jgi:hypothetical protein
MLGHMTRVIGAHVLSHPVSAAGDGHAALYECCAALIVAVMVVLYFDERVRRDLSARLRGYAIGSLGGIIGTGLLIPLFALAGFISDTSRIRAVTVAYTLVFLAAAFSIAVRSWAVEDAARLHPTRPAQLQLPPLSLPAPRAGMTEREHAAEVLGVALSIIAEFQPAAVLVQLGRTGPGPEKERLAGLTAQWYALQPSLMAISAGYPSAVVRKHVRAFTLAAVQAVKQPAILFSDKDALADEQAQAQWRDQANVVSEAAAHAWDKVVSALHTGKTTGAKTSQADATKNGRSIPSP